VAYDPEFGEWVREHLAGLGPIELKRMFGAAAAKMGDRMFAIVDDGEIWLKADATLAAELQAQGSRQFIPVSKDGGEMPMPYWSLPDSAVDDPDEAVAWARRAVEVASAPKPKKARKAAA
jgi:DNA transformation protein and related proteins